jgi:serralysin
MAFSIQNINLKTVFDPNAVYTPIDVEALTEATQDNDRSGFQNLGGGSDSRTIIKDSAANLKINAQGGDDSIGLFGEGNDVVHGGSGNDRITTDLGNDTASGGSGDDTIDGGAGSDFLTGGSGADIIFGGAGVDTVDGGSGNDFLAGDHIFDETAVHGADLIRGGKGNDTMQGLGGGDELWGGAGADVFQYLVFRDLTNNAATSDHIMDFSRIQGDKIDFSQMDANLTVNGRQNFTLATTEAQKSQPGKFFLGEVNANGEQQVFLNFDGGGISGQFDGVITVKLADAGSTGLTLNDFLLI